MLVWKLSLPSQAAVRPHRIFLLDRLWVSCDGTIALWGAIFCEPTDPLHIDTVFVRSFRLRSVWPAAASLVQQAFPSSANTGPTMSESGPAPSAFDRYGNANYDANGTYIGGHGIGTQVDNPDNNTFGLPSSSMPNISSMHCTGATGAKAGTLNCSN